MLWFSSKQTFFILCQFFRITATAEANIQGLFFNLSKVRKISSYIIIRASYREAESLLIFKIKKILHSIKNNLITRFCFKVQNFGI